jgi:hypothetical protein
MKFVYGSDVFEPTVKHSYPYPELIKLVQVKDTTASGTTHVETFDVVITGRTLKFEEMPHDDYQGLIDWFLNIVDGMGEVFEFYDDAGDFYNVRFASEKISFSMIGASVDDEPVWAGTVALEVVP